MCQCTATLARYAVNNYSLMKRKQERYSQINTKLVKYNDFDVKCVCVLE